MASNILSFDPLVFIPLVGVLIGIIVGLLGIWTSIKSRSREQKDDLKDSLEQVIIWTREYVKIKAETTDTKIDSVRNEMKQMYEMEAKNDQLLQFFAKWNQRIEDRIDRLHPEVPGNPEIKVIDDNVMEQLEEEEQEK